MVDSKRMYLQTNRILFANIPLLIIITLGLSCCTGGYRLLHPPGTRAPEQFPVAEIVFRAPGYTLGFVNADGSDASYVRFVVKDYGNRVSDWWRPVITGDNRTVLVKVIESHYYISAPQTLALWTSGEFPVLCWQWAPQQFPSLDLDQDHLIIQTEQGVALYEFSDCGTQDASPTTVYEGVFGVFSPDMNYIVMIKRPSADPDADRFVIVRNLVSGEENTIGTGDYPAWSRDSRWLAYTGTDGIYVADIVEGTDPRRVVQYPNLFDERNPTYSDGAYWQIPPEVSWSPDGQWLIYHKWLGTDENTGIYPENNAIFKLNIETGEETKVLDGGMYPSWRWSAEP